MPSAAYDGIEAGVPDARVVLGGLQRPDQTQWLTRVFATPGTDAIHKFDIASVHLRGPVGRWRTATARSAHGSVRVASPVHCG